MTDLSGKLEKCAGRCERDAGRLLRLGRSLLAVAISAPWLALAAAAEPAFSPPAPLNSNAAFDSGSDLDLQFTTDGVGNWVAVWKSNENLDGTAGTDHDIFVATSADNGGIWTDPALLNSNGTSDTGSDNFPQITTDGGGNWVAVWTSTENLAGTAGTDPDIFVARSADNGVSWTPPALLNSNGTSDSGADSLPQFTTDGAGNWAAVWNSYENLDGTAGTDSDIFIATSVDNGGSWTDPELLNANGTSDVEHDFSPQLTTDDGGNWVAAWTSSENLDGTAGTDQDIFVATSTDNGVSWTDPALLNINGNSDMENDGNPQITTDDGGNWLAVWNSFENLDGTAGTDLDIFVATSTDNGSSWTDPALLNTNGTSDVNQDAYPQLTTDGAGHWVAVWYSDENLNGTAGTDFDIFVATSADNGGSWTDPALLNTNGTSDVEHDFSPQLTTDGGGNWLAAWASTEDLGGTVGTDTDIFIATSVDIDGDSWPDSLENALGTDPLDPTSRPGNAFKLLHPEGEAVDWFGGAVAISGDTAIVGADFDDHDGLSLAGSAFVFTQDSDGLWTLQQTLVASNATNNSRFGFSVGISGDTAIVGTYKVGDDVSYAYIFTRTGGVWTEQQTLTASDGVPGDLFGFSVAVSGDRALVGAYHGTDDLGVDSGSAYVFTRTFVTWTEQQKLLPGDPASADAFGYAVAISGATAVVSGHGNDDNGPQSGSAYVFTETSGTWSEQQKLLPLDGMASDSFGFSVGIEGETVIVGADLDDHGAEVDAGSAYVFTRSGLVWSQQQKLTADDYAGGDNFGWSVSVSGDMAVVGAVGDDYFAATYSGSAYEFKRNSLGTWAQVAKLVAPDRAGLDDKTGRAVAIEGDTAILGARDAETAGSASGAAYAFFLDADGDGVSDDLDAFPNDPSETVDSDGDGVGDNADAFPLDITEWLDTDSDGIGNNADLDDDGDVIPDVNDQGPLDAANCRVKELRVVLVWDVGTPFGLDHQRGPLGRHRYLRRELAELNGSNGYQLPGFASAELLATELETVATDLETLLNFQPMGLPINDNYVTVENCFGPSAAGCVPAQGPGSAAVLYVSDRAQLPTDPDPSVDFGPLEGVAWDGVERFARGCEGRRAVVLVTSSDLGDAEFPGLLVEKLAHELGHLYGLRHILTTDAASCTTPLTDAAVMDYVPDRAALFADCDSPGCAVVEPPVCDGSGSGSGQPTAGTHNPLYHFLHFALGHADDDLGALPIPLVDGSWDREEEPLLIWHIEFTFTCGLCDEPSSDVFYNVTFYEQLPDGSTVPIPLNEAGDTTLAEISLEELNELNFLLPASSALQLTFSSGDPNNGGPTEADVTFEFPFQPQEDGVVVTQNVELAKDENGTIVKDPVGNEATPTLEIQEDGTYLVGTDTLINSNTEVPPAIAVPEPHPVLQLFAGIVGLLALGRLRARKPRGPG